MIKAHEDVVTIRQCVEFFGAMAPGAAFIPSAASSEYRRRYMAPPDRAGGQTIARILVAHCGWIRQGRVIYKPLEELAV